jgi:hypothetical protein
MEGWPPPPQKKTLFLSPGLNISYSIQKSTLPYQFEDLPPKKGKKKIVFVSIITNSHM